MKSQVFWSDLRVDPKRNLFSKLDQLLDKVELSQVVKERDLVAIKLHFGEKGNTSFIRPIFIRHIVDRVKRHGGKPFVTDTNTLYVGTRSDTVSHITTAIENGFAYSVIGAPIIIADGLRGASFIEVRVDKEIYDEVYIASEIVYADILISVAHLKAHELSGFGGTLKNLGMGCAARPGKLSQHSNIAPKIDRSLCNLCYDCLPYCAPKAIYVSEAGIGVDDNKCTGCGECIIVCPREAIKIQYNESIPIFQKKMMEYAYGALKGKEGKSMFVNFITQVSPACDCYGHSDAPIVPDVGILASRDPVAIDQASADLVNVQKGLEDSALSSHFERGEDKFRSVYPQVDWRIQLEYAEAIGMGTREYELVRI